LLQILILACAATTQLLTNQTAKEMRILTTCLLSLCFYVAAAQSKQDSIRTIEETLVKRSAAAFANYQYDEQFNLVSDDVTLVLTDLSKIENKQGYKDIIKRIGETQKGRGITRSIQFRYHKFIINSDLTYAEGIFKISLTNPAEASPRTQYSAFTHIYRLENGQWKVLMDSHTTNPGLTEGDFLKAKAIYELK